MVPKDMLDTQQNVQVHLFLPDIPICMAWLKRIKLQFLPKIVGNKCPLRNWIVSINQLRQQIGTRAGNICLIFAPPKQVSC